MVLEKQKKNISEKVVKKWKSIWKKRNIETPYKIIRTFFGTKRITGNSVMKFSVMKNLK